MNNVDIYKNDNLDIYENEIDKSISKNYEKSLKNIYVEISNIFAKFSSNNVLTYEDMIKFDRLIKLEKTIYNELNALFGDEYNLIYNNLKNLYQNAYLLNSFEMIQDSQQDIRFKMIPIEQVKKAIETPISGLNILDRVNKNKQDTFFKFKEIITSHLIRGTSIQKLSNEISSNFDISKQKSLRIARTENNRIRNAGTQESYNQAKKLGVEFRKMWVSTLDKKTRDSHKKLDGQFADKDGYFHYQNYKTLTPSNFGVASLDINCRCSTIAKFDNIGNNKRKENITKDIIKYKNYSEWSKSI